MKKSDYRKFIIRGDEAPGGRERAQNDDFASMYEAVVRRYRRLQEEKKALPGLILIDGAWGNCAPRPRRWSRCKSLIKPMASIAKKEEILYVLGQEDEPLILERHLAGAAPDSADSR